MSYQIFVMCDLVDCGARVEVPQQGMLPVGWVATKTIKVDLRARPGAGVNQPTVEQTLVFCGPRCTVKHFKAQLAGGD